MAHFAVLPELTHRRERQLGR